MTRGIWIAAAGLALTLVGGSADAQVRTGGRPVNINGQFMQFVPGVGFVPAARTQAEITDPFVLQLRAAAEANRQLQAQQLQQHQLLLQQRLAALQQQSGQQVLTAEQRRAAAVQFRAQQQALAVQRRAQLEAQALQLRQQIAAGGVPAAVFQAQNGTRFPGAVGGGAFPTGVMIPPNTAPTPAAILNQAMAASQAQALARRGLVPVSPLAFGANPASTLGMRVLAGPGPGANFQVNPAVQVAIPGTPNGGINTGFVNNGFNTGFNTGVPAAGIRTLRSFPGSQTAVTGNRPVGAVRQ